VAEPCPGWNGGQGGSTSCIKERGEPQSLLGGCRVERKPPHGRSAAAPVPSAVSLGGQRGEARRSIRSSALPSRQGARTWPGSPAACGGCPAVAPSQRLHRPVHGRLRRLAYLRDSICASHGPLATARCQELAVLTRVALAVGTELSTRAGERGRTTWMACSVRKQVAEHLSAAQHREVVGVESATRPVSPSTLVEGAATPREGDAR
jgi:hypothetical protein